MVYFRTTIATALAAASALAQTSGASSYQVDLLLPQNTTYLPSASLPVAIAIHNPSALDASPGNWSIAWHLMKYRDGRSPSGTILQSGTFVPFLVDQPSNTTSSGRTLDKGEPSGQNTGVYVGSVNTSAWIDEKKAGDVVSFRWYVIWNGITGASTYPDRRCDATARISGSVVFSVEAPFEKERAAYMDGWVSAGKGVDAKNTTLWPACPVVEGLASTLEAVSDQAKCPIVVTEREGGRIQCSNLLLGQERQKDVLKAVESVAAASLAASTTTTGEPTPTPTPTGAAARLDISGRVVAAACAVGCVALVV